VTQVLKGKCAVPGIAIGNIVRIEMDVESGIKDYKAGTTLEETEKFRVAHLAVEEEFRQIIETANAAGLKEQIAIMEAHQIILSDPVLETNIMEQIGMSLSAPLAVLKGSEKVSDILSALDDPYLRERAADIKDVGKKIACTLLGIRQPDFSEGDVILCGDEIDPSVVANIPDGKVTGIIMGNGSVTSHAVIIAKAKGIATVVGMGDGIGGLTDGNAVILDGNLGEIIIHAESEQLEAYRQRIEKEKEMSEYYLSLSRIPAVTMNGVPVTLAANIGNPRDIDTAVKYGCEGVGLFRTEFVFMGRDSFPTEEEQFEAYKYVVEKCCEKLCVIRTMDIGGDKPLSYLEIDKEDNPFLGWRAIRICLERTEIFITQVKAILRAGVYGNVAIMLPMIISTDEIKKAKVLIKQAMEEMDVENTPYAEDVPVGIMIETPAAAVMADVLAKECSFFSIGTNDLVQYTLAVDRGNPNVSGLYSHYNPAVLRLIDNVIKAGHSNNIWVGMCGEMAGDVAASKLLVSMGIDELSMSAPSIPRVKETILRISTEEEFADKTLSIHDAIKVEEYLKRSAV